MEIAQPFDQRVESPFEIAGGLVVGHGELLAAHHQAALGQVGLVEALRELDQHLVALDEDALQDALHGLGNGGIDLGPDGFEALPPLSQVQEVEHVRDLRSRRRADGSPRPGGGPGSGSPTR